MVDVSNVGPSVSALRAQGHNRVNRTSDNPVVIGGDSMFWPQLYGSQKVHSSTSIPATFPFLVTKHDDRAAECLLLTCKGMCDF